MVNLLGEPNYTGAAKCKGIESVLALGGVNVHLYGKAITKPFRKMGHVTIVDEDTKRLREKAKFVKHTLKIIAAEQTASGHHHGQPIWFYGRKL